MSTRSITPRISCSAPIGISVATTWGPNAVLSDSSVRKKSARSRSSMFTKTNRATPSSAARVHSRWVETSTPITPLTTKTADSHTRSAPRASAMNDGSPGVSIRLTFTSRQSNDASAAEIDIPRACSSWSESDTVDPSATVPSRVVAPASNSRASCSDVFPLPRWPTRATLRILSAACGMPSPLPRTEGGRLPSVPQVVSLEPRLQAQDGLRVQLRDPGLGDAEDLADLPQGQVLVVVEGDHELLALGQRGDRVREAVLELGGVEQLLRVRGVRVMQRVEQGDLVAGGVRDRPQLVERDDRGVGDLHQALLELLDRDAELLGHLFVRGGAVQAVLEPAVHPLDLAGTGAHRARHPVQRAQLVDDRALDARDRVGLELDLALGVEALDRVDEADQAVGDEVGLLDVRGQAGGHAARDVLDQRRVGDHELLAGAVRPRRLVATPQIPQLDGFHVGLQALTLPPTPGDGSGHRRPGGALTLPECRPGWSRWTRGPGAPESPANRHLPRAGGSRRSGAAHADAPRPGARRGAPTPAGGGARRRSRGAARTSRAAARARPPRPRARGVRARGSAPRSAAPAPPRARIGSCPLSPPP